jgi:tetratricopeptide (TPR) repeat protein
MYLARPLPVLLCIATARLLAASADSTEGLRTAGFMDQANRGLAEIWNLDFDAATRSLTTLAGQYPGHPAPPLYQATVVLVRELDGRHELVLDRFVHPGYFMKQANRAMPAASRQQFFEFIGKSQLLTERRLKSSPQDRDAQYLRGATEGLLALFAFTIDRSYLQAFKHGKQAYGLHNRLIEQDRQYYDAYMSVGLYDYVANSLPWYLRWAAGITGFHADKQRAFQFLNSAVEKGRYVSDDARLFRMAVSMREGRPPEALPDAAALLARYPRNAILHLTEAQILDRMGRRDEAADTYLQVVRFAEEGKPNYQRIDGAALRWQTGNMLLAMRPRTALDSYRVLLQNPATQERWRVLAMLQSGCALDLLGRREEAIQQYKTVLSMNDYDNAHAHASEHLQSPYTVTPNSVSLPRLSSQ